MNLRYCKRCGFILGTRPGLLEEDGVCLACINNDKKKDIDFKSRQNWLTEKIRINANDNDWYDCVIAVSGGKDSHTITRRLIENHGIRRPLLVNITDEFTHTKAGLYNIKNLVTRYDTDLYTIRYQPMLFKNTTRIDFFNELHPLKWIEERLYAGPIDTAENLSIPLVFFGENSAFEYGTSPELTIQHPYNGRAEVIYMGAIYPYSITDSLKTAREIGFKDLDDFNEWPREGSIEQYTQIDSVAYIMQLWTKYPKFGFQRVSDIACRLVREGVYTRDEAMDLIREHDYKCDPAAKKDFCDTVGITAYEFDEAVDRHANTDIVRKESDGMWHRI